MKRKKTGKVSEPALAARRAKQPKNLLLDEDALERGEAYSRRHGTTLSRLVGDFLRNLPLAPDEIATPAVKRLRGVARGSGLDEDDYRAHLRRKYGR